MIPSGLVHKEAVIRVTGVALLLFGLMAVSLGNLHASASGPKKEIRLVTDPETTTLLTDLSRPLIQAARLPPDRVRFHVILDGQINAFALPNQNIVFNSGLMLATAGRDELAAVMAHEIAHLAAGHHRQLQEAASSISLRTLIATAIGVAAGVASGDGQVASAIVTGSRAMGQSALIATIREREIQADRLAFRYLQEARYDPEGLARFMDRLARLQRLSTLPPDYMLTHPLGSQRLMEARDYIANHPPVHVREDRESIRLARVRAKLEAGTSPDPDQAASRFLRRLEKDPQRLEWQYGLALARRYAGQLDKAHQDLNRLAARVPDDPFILRERGLTLLEMGRLDSALKDFTAAQQQLPDNTDIQYRIALTLKEQQHYEDASRILYRLTTQDPQDAQSFYLLGHTEQKRDRPGFSHLALARYYRLTLDRDSALWHYQQALAHFPQGSREKGIVQRELRRMDQPKTKPE